MHVNGNLLVAGRIQDEKATGSNFGVIWQTLFSYLSSILLMAKLKRMAIDIFFSKVHSIQSEKIFFKFPVSNTVQLKICALY